MVPWPNVAAFVLASAVLVAIPGPSMLFVIGRSLAYGRRGGLFSVLGNGLGVVPPVLAVSAGIGAVVAQSVAAFTVVKLAGAAYLVYLGMQTIRHSRVVVTAAEPTSRVPAARVLLGQGMLVGITNPKTTVFLVAVLPQFVAFENGTVWLQLLTLGGIYVLVALTGDSCTALAAGAARDWFARSPGRISLLQRTGGAMMIGLGGLLAVSGHKS